MSEWGNAMTQRHRETSVIDVEVAIIGAGPAGRWLGALLAERKLSVAVIDPTPRHRWPNSYGIWLDEVEGLVARRYFERIWDRAVGYFPARCVLQRRYGRLDNEAFRAALDQKLKAGNTRWVEAAVSAVESCATGGRLRCDGDVDVEARLVVDATGVGHFVADESADASPCQRAYGVVATFDADPLGGESMVLMDYRPWGPGGEEPPSFLYAMNLGEGRYFLEETVLVGPETVSFEELAHRLWHRLEGRGVRRVGRIVDEERCHIPMGTPLPQLRGPIVAFGAAAGFVHPATGYQMSRMLRTGPAVADAVAEGLRRGMAGAALATRAWQVVWPTTMRRARQLCVFGRDVLRSLDREGLCRFFQTFFALPDRDWRDYLRGDGDIERLSQIMWRLFRRVEPGLRWALIKRAVADRGRLYEAFRRRRCGA